MKKIVIAGAGEVAVALIRRFLEEYSALITVIDADREACERITRMFGSVHVIWGNAADPRVLREARVGGADVFIAVTGNDAINIISSLLAKKEGVPVVITKVKGMVEYEDLARSLGLDRVVSLGEVFAAEVDLMIRSPDLADLLGKVRKDIEVFEVTVGPEKDGTQLRESGFVNEQTNPFIVVREGEILLPKPHLVLRKGDRLVLIRKKKGFSIPLIG